SLEDPREVVTLRDREPEWAGEEKRTYIDQVEVLTGLVPGELLVKVPDRESEVIAAQGGRTCDGWQQRPGRLSAHRQRRGEIHRPFPDALRRQVPEELLEAKLH